MKHDRSCQYGQRLLGPLKESLWSFIISDLMQVRNSAGGIVQLSYGDDGLDPVAMEAGEGKPLNLARSLSVVHATTPRPPRCPENAAEDGETLLNKETLQYARITKICPDVNSN